MREYGVTYHQFRYNFGAGLHGDTPPDHFIFIYVLSYVVHGYLFLASACAAPSVISRSLIPQVVSSTAYRQFYLDCVFFEVVLQLVYSSILLPRIVIINMIELMSLIYVENLRTEHLGTRMVAYTN